MCIRDSPKPAAWAAAGADTAEIDLDIALADDGYFGGDSVEEDLEFAHARAHVAAAKYSIPVAAGGAGQGSEWGQKEGRGGSAGGSTNPLFQMDMEGTWREPAGSPYRYPGTEKERAEATGKEKEKKGKKAAKAEQTAALESEWEAVTSQYQIPKADVQGSSKQVAPAAPPVRPALRPARRKTGP
eukprot:15059-Prorocentrum_minimum.AAC.2